MILTPAPFHQLPGIKESPAEAFWVRADDDVRLRVAMWRAENARGTVFLFPGRTEYCEKFAPVAQELMAGGLSVLAIDWRGQGMADRLQDDARPGHVEDFAHYQLDVIAMAELAAGLDLPEPWHLLAHSMGGAIGLAAVLNGLPVATAAFSAPMWGINHAPMPRRVAQAISGAANRVGRGGSAAIGTGGPGAYVLQEPFADNLITSCPESWCRELREASAWPELTIGGPSYRWVGQALAECHRLANEPAPDLPALIAVGSEERVVSVPAIRNRASGWPGAELLEIDGARHELMFETPPRRRKFLSAALALFTEGP